MEHGQIDAEGLQQVVGQNESSAWVRAVCGPLGDGVAELWHAEIILGPWPDEEGRLWQYADCTFIAGHVAPEDLAQALTPGVRTALNVHGVSLTFQFNPYINFQRKPSFGGYDELPLAWPSVGYTLSLSFPDNQLPQGPSGFLVGDGPAFAAFGAAFRAFFTGNYAYSGTQNPTLGQLYLRHCDLRGRITGVEIGLTALDLTAEGAALRSADFELMAVSDRAKIAASPGAVRLPLPNGLPEESWLWLRLEDDWLDYRPISVRSIGPTPDVRDVRPVQPESDLLATIATGEGPGIEFKRELPSGSNPGLRRSALKGIVAFANGAGGTLLYGVDDDGSIPGLSEADGRTCDRFISLIRSWTQPMPVCTATLQDVGDRKVLVVDVQGGGSTIHALTIDADKPEYYVRRGANSFYAKPEELQMIAGRDRQQAPRGLRGMLG